jgi:hypothetical protein
MRIPARHNNENTLQPEMERMIEAQIPSAG